MLSTKGFLAERGPGEPPRLTAQHLTAVLQALSAVRDHFNRTQPAATQADYYARGAAEAMITSMVEAFPRDRSCVTCDYFSGGNCCYWKDDVPAEAVDAGCDEHQTDGAPF